jgi:putative endonuclease
MVAGLLMRVHSMALSPKYVRTTNLISICKPNMDRTYWVYILASQLGGTLYIGVTNDLVRRIYEHRHGLADGFTKTYEVHRLVYFEQFDQIEFAILREKRLKKWKRAWKIRLIEEHNPDWVDLYPHISSP